MNIRHDAGRPNMYVPSSGNTDNVYINDVIGNKNDDHTIATNLAGRTHTQYEHTHSVSHYYPSLAANVTLTAGTSAFSLGAIATIVPANTITDAFDIHFIHLTNASAAGNYVIRLYQGSTGAETKIGEIRVTQAVGLANLAPLPVMTPLIVANTRISGAVATSTSGAASIDIALNYHTY